MQRAAPTLRHAACMHRLVGVANVPPDTQPQSMHAAGRAHVVRERERRLQGARADSPCLVDIKDGGSEVWS